MQDPNKGPYPHANRVIEITEVMTKFHEAGFLRGTPHELIARLTVLSTESLGNTTFDQQQGNQVPFAGNPIW